MGVRRGGGSCPPEKSKISNNYMENTKWIKQHKHFSTVHSVRAGHYTWNRNWSRRGSLPKLSMTVFISSVFWLLALCCGGHLACRGRTDVYHSSLILTSSSHCAMCWRTFPLYTMLQAEDSLAHSREHRGLHRWCGDSTPQWTLPHSAGGPGVRIAEA